MGGVGGGGQGGFADITHNIPLLVLLSEHSRYCSRATVPHSWGKHCLLLTVISRMARDRNMTDHEYHYFAMNAIRFSLSIMNIIIYRL